MITYKLEAYFKFDSNDTAQLFAHVLSKTMQITASTTIDISKCENAHVTLGKTTIKTFPKFIANR
jgi:hypothetical protein